MDTLYIVVPCYNEEEVLPESARVLRQKILSLIERGLVKSDSRLLFVDDGSTDGTWRIIEKLCAENTCIDGLKLRQNRGHQNALMAGLLTAVRFADATVSIDADLQDDVDAIDGMVTSYNSGVPIVCGVRKSRDTDSFMKRFTAHTFYFIMRITGSKSIYDHADFRLMSRDAVDRLACFGCEDLYLRGLITRLGLPISKVYYDRMPRLAGESKYTLRKMLKLAIRGFKSSAMTPSESPEIGDLYIEKHVHG